MVEILNPLTEDQSVMRTTLIPGLLATAQRNVAQQIKNLKFFEIGKIFIQKNRNELPEEIEMLCGLWTGSSSPANWLTKETWCDFYDIKGSVEGLFRALKVADTRFSQMPADGCYYMKPGYTAEIFIRELSLGLVGEMRTDVLSRFELKHPTFMFELDVQKLSSHIPDIHRANAISKFPAISRDITIIIDKGIETGSIIKKVEDFQENLIENLHVFDVFQGDPVPDGKKSISFRITYRSAKETLKDETINTLHKDLTSRLVKSFNAALPS